MLEDCKSEKKRMKFQQMLEDHHKLLYPGCEDGLNKLGSILELLQWKAMHGVLDKGFGELLKQLKICFLRTTNCLPQHTKSNNLFAL